MKAINRRAFLALACTVAIATAGCSSSDGTIKGNVDEVVTACAELSDAEDPVIVEVNGATSDTGYALEHDDGSAEIMLLGDSGACVDARFEDVSDELLEELNAPGEKTVRGTLDSVHTDLELVYLEDCELVD